MAKAVNEIGGNKMNAVSISTTDTAKMIRTALKAAFPAVKFSVRSSLYSGGSSINVSWTDGPTDSEVSAITSNFSGATFDGMTDCKNYHNTLMVLNGEQLPTLVSFGADYVFTNRSMSKEFINEVQAMAQTVLDSNDHTKGQTFNADTYYQNLATSDFSFDAGYGSNLVYRLAYTIKREMAVA